MNAIEAIAMFILLFFIAAESVQRLGRVGWEWAIFGWYAIGTSSVFVIDIIVPRFFSELSIINIFITKAMLYTTPVVIFFLYHKFEQPVKKSGMIWRYLRSICALYLAFLLILSVGYSFGSLNLYNITRSFTSSTNLLLIGFAFFATTQIGIYVNRDRKKVIHHKQVEFQRQKQAELTDAEKVMIAPKEIKKEQAFPISVEKCMSILNEVFIKYRIEATQRDEKQTHIEGYWLKRNMDPAFAWLEKWLSRYYIKATCTPQDDGSTLITIVYNPKRAPVWVRPYSIQVRTRNRITETIDNMFTYIGEYSE